MSLNAKMPRLCLSAKEWIKFKKYNTYLNECWEVENEKHTQF